MAGFFKNLLNKITNKADVDWDELEADLIGSDIGVRMAIQIVEELQDLGRKVSGDEIVATTRKHIADSLPGDPVALKPRSQGPYVILMVGINGTGKTTSSAKLAYYLKNQGHSVLLAAADTFRAAAVDQLDRWGTRLDIPVLKGAPNADPSSVCYTAHQKAIADGTDFLICDTAGRIHTRDNLMSELGKIRRTLGKQEETSPHLTLLVVDATTGGNALEQARQFHKAADLDGIVVTKLDGSGKGGVAVAIHNELEIPTHFLGTGEEPEQFRPFKKDEYVNDLL